MTAKPPISLTISPYHVVAAPGQRHLARHITLTNSGRWALRISTGFQQVRATPHGQCALVRPPGWVSMSPAAFTLRPGQSKVTTVTVSAPRSARGHYDLAAVYTGAPAAQQAGALRVTGAAGARVLLSYPGTTTSHPCEVAAPPARHQPASPSPLPGLVFLAVLVAALAAGGTWAWRRYRRRPHLM